MKVVGHENKDVYVAKQLVLQARIPLKPKMDSNKFSIYLKYKLCRNPSKEDS